MVTTYSVCQKTFNPEGRHNPNVHFLAGAVAGGVACAVTMPLDVCKTLLNTQESVARFSEKRICVNFRYIPATLTARFSQLPQKPQKP